MAGDRFNASKGRLALAVCAGGGYRHHRDPCSRPRFLVGVAQVRRPGAENARLVARNRLCTQVKFMPLRSLPDIALVELGSTIRAIRDRRLISTLAGKLAAMSMLPALLRDRRRLRDGGDMRLARCWLGRSRS